MSIERIIKEYEEKKENLIEYDSYINHVREYKGYVFKEINDIKKFNNEAKWLNKLMELKYDSPKMIGTYNQVIITEKIDADAINDNEAKEHLYNIGKLIANLHNLSIKTNVDWKQELRLEFKELKALAENIIEEKLYKSIVDFIEKTIENIKISKTCIIHKDIRPGNVLHKEGKYYLLDFESMSLGDRDYDFIRMFNIFNQKEIYTYEDFKKFVDGYNSISKIDFSIEKWKLYSKYYAFRMYTRILSGKVNRSEEFERYLMDILEDKKDRITEWIEKYNLQ